MRERPAWARRLWLWITDGQYDRIMNISDEHWRWTLADKIERAGVKVLCAVFKHKPIPDQCAMPEHDFCVFCNKPMPFGHPRPPVSDVTPETKETDR